jgi:Tfp pilus assembly protein PilV
MRRVFFSLLILLTAFRGMVGDAMAYEMTQQAMQNSIAIESIAHRADSMSAAGHFSSEKAALMPCHQASDDMPSEVSANACTTCQVCHLTASLPSALLGIKADAPRHGLQAAGTSSWLSAELQSASKPPIL